MNALTFVWHSTTIGLMLFCEREEKKNPFDNLKWNFNFVWHVQHFTSLMFTNIRERNKTEWKGNHRNKHVEQKRLRSWIRTCYHNGLIRFLLIIYCWFQFGGLLGDLFTVGATEYHRRNEEVVRTEMPIIRN